MVDDDDAISYANQPTCNEKGPDNKAEPTERPSGAMLRFAQLGFCKQDDDEDLVRCVGGFHS